MSDRMAELVAALERVPDGEARTLASELMGLVLDMHGEAVGRLLELVAAADGDAAAALRGIAGDDVVRPVLELHGLVPPAEAESAPVTFVRRERCELCGAPAGDDHPHLLDMEGPQGTLACACRPCHLLLAAPGAGGGRWRAVPDEWRAVDAVDLPDVPVGVSFVVVDSRTGGAVAFYPGPAGATESELDVAVDLLPPMTPDVEALVIRGHEAYVVPVSAAYGLVGELRTAWKGLTGGDAPERVLNTFFTRAARRSWTTEGSEV
jgi:hypothetical protein